MLYVYVDCRLDNGEPFYVGIGNKYRLRKPYRNDKHRKIALACGSQRVIVDCSEDRKYVEDVEISLIRELKTRDHQGGANFTDGGKSTQGFKFKDESRLKMREKKLGRKLSDEHRANMSKSQKKRNADPNVRKAHGNKLRNRWDVDAEFRERETARKSRGSKHWMTKFTEFEVHQMRDEFSCLDKSERGTFYERWASKLGCTTQTIYNVVKRRTWKHV